MGSLLNIDANAKTVKGQKVGYMTGVHYLAPSDESGVANVCVMAGKCKGPCLNKSGRALIDPAIIEARIRRTKELFADRKSYIARLDKEICALERKAAREGFIPCVRLNGTSDLYWLVKELAPKHPTTQFYDYTKLPRPYQREFSNYHLTFSFDSDGPEGNWNATLDALNHGSNVAVCFDVRRGQPLPESWRGYKVVDGDVNDLRFLEGHQSLVIGLRAKGLAKKDKGGFVQIAAMAESFA